MSDTPNTSRIPVEGLRLIDLLCDVYEAGRQGGATAQIQEVVRSAPEPLRRALFQQLIAIERECREAEGKPLASLELHEPAPEVAAPNAVTESGDRPQPANPVLSPGEEHRFGIGAGRIIGHYKLLEPIGEGGMGVVYLAEQREHLHRRVALKIIKPGMDSQQVVARFEAERQALAMMDHPHIAKVLDAGTTDSGLPYFAMELVRGVPITRFCDESRLPIRARLELFVQVCRAIQHAHQKGIIHRDIKPTNVMVALYDNQPVAKVIDFGVAKSVEQRLTGNTLFTQLGRALGTFEYMSPEQAEMNPLGMDTRSDIYSLGVLLYELLIGITPLERERIRSSTYPEVVRLIKEEEPLSPSQWVATEHERLPSVCEKRSVEPATLQHRLQGTLDAIVGKCLEKDRASRYQTANDVAQKVECYLANEPVDVPPARPAQPRKLSKRVRGAVIAASVGFISLLVGLLVAANQDDEGPVGREVASREIVELAVTDPISLPSTALPSEAASPTILPRGKPQLTLTAAGDIHVSEGSGAPKIVGGSESYPYTALVEDGAMWYALRGDGTAFEYEPFPRRSWRPIGGGNPNPYTRMVVVRGQLYVLRGDGEVLSYPGTPLLWRSHGGSEREPFTQIVGVRGELYALKGTGLAYVHDPIDDKWIHIGGTVDNPFTHMVDVGREVYVLQRDGQVLSYVGSPQEWKHRGGARTEPYTALVSVRDQLYALKWCGIVEAYDPAENKWSYSIGDVHNPHTDLVAVRDGLYTLRSTGEAHVYDPAQKRWTIIGGSVIPYTTLVGVRGRLYGLRADGGVYIFDGKAGKWTHSVGDPSDPYTALVDLRGNLYTLRANGLAYIYHLSEDEWAHIGGSIGHPNTHMAASHGHLYVLRGDGELFSYSGKLYATGQRYEWSKHGGSMQDPYTEMVSLRDELYALKRTGQAYIHDYLKDTWTHIGGTADNPYTHLLGVRGGLYALQRDGQAFSYSGTPTEWTHIGGSELDPYTTLVVANGELYAFKSIGVGYVYDGSRSLPGRWTYLVGDVKNPHTHLVAVRGQLYALHSAGEAQAYDPTQKQWNHIGGSTDDPYTHMAHVQGKLYVVRDGQEVLSYTGTPQEWTSMTAEDDPNVLRLRKGIEQPDKNSK